jgi:hypothetical protein
MTAAEVPPARVRWYRRRPADGMHPATRAVWWAGQALLFAGPTVLAIGLAVFVAASVLTPGISLGGSVGVVLVAVAGPIAVSGRWVRAEALRLAEPEQEGWRRIAAPVVVVLGIAFVATVLAYVSFLILFTAWWFFVGPW